MCGDQKTPDDLAQKQQAFADVVHDVLDEVSETLIAKNACYGDSALDPLRVFSRAGTVEQLRVRIDDKLSRIRTMGPYTDSEDTLLDLLGYLVLLRIAMRKGEGGDK